MVAAAAPLLHAEGANAVDESAATNAAGGAFFIARGILGPRLRIRSINSKTVLSVGIWLSHARVATVLQ